MHIISIFGLVMAVGIVVMMVMGTGVILMMNFPQIKTPRPVSRAGRMSRRNNGG
jgi:maltodextrin utilization protein YvdJ